MGPKFAMKWSSGIWLQVLRLHYSTMHNLATCQFSLQTLAAALAAAMASHRRTKVCVFCGSAPVFQNKHWCGRCFVSWFASGDEMLVFHQFFEESNTNVTLLLSFV